MSQLTNQQINQSYQGLLNLADSTTGVTNSLQSVQDGLGNNLPFKISSTIFAPNVGLVYPNYGAADYYGVGFNTTSNTPVAQTQNYLVCLPFMDRGEYSYSAISYNITNATSTSDVVNIAFYNSRMLSGGRGLAPYEVVASGYTWQTTGTGLRTDTFGTNISFSASGPGVYWMVYSIDNANVTPTVRYATPSTINIQTLGQLSPSLGYAIGPSGAYTNPWKTNTTSSSACMTINLNSYPNPFTEADIDLAVNSNSAQFGFVLHTVK